MKVRAASTLEPFHSLFVLIKHTSCKEVGYKLKCLTKTMQSSTELIHMLTAKKKSLTGTHIDRLQCDVTVPFYQERINTNHALLILLMLGQWL